MKKNKNINNKKDKIYKYRECYVAYVDILGFKSLVEESITNTSKQEAIQTALELFNRFKRINKSLETAMVTTFSDCIVISDLANDSSSLIYLCLVLIQIQSLLFFNGIVIRGAITKGKLVHTPTKVFGPAMNEAYLLESKYAIYPRVIIEKETVEEYAKSIHIDVRQLFDENFFVLDPYGDLCFINCLYYSNLIYKNEDEYYDLLLSAIDTIEKGTNNPNKDIQLKYKWLSNFYVSVLADDERFAEEIDKLQKDQYNSFMSKK